MVYFISFRGGNDKNTGDGNAEVARKNKIKTVAEVREIEKELAKENNLKWVTVTNFILLSK